MIKFYYRVLLLIPMAIAVSCVTTRDVDIRAMEPAPVSLSDKIKRVGIIGGEIHIEGGKEENSLNRLISRENEQMILKARDAAIAGLYYELASDKRFDTILLMEDVGQNVEDLQDDGNYLNWKTIEALCREYEVDAIFSLAYYNADTKVSLKNTKMEQNDLLRVKYKVNGQQITLETLIENGWRIYDPSNKLVLDEFSFNNQIVSTAKGLNPYEALQAIEGRVESIIEQSKIAGSSYGSRLQPNEYSITRAYYVKGTPEFEKAESFTLSGDWESAANLWRSESENPDPKISSKACYNLAILNERNNRLVAAVDWANKAYSKHSSKKNSAYIKALEFRMSQNEILQEQKVNISSK
ncbi:DUF6340 family protein [uncultured Eudoraea sp.]|uniref:DUF6340 family protein n=1 Tax=uncultured Eudoraea sp. TaxID=1035614 RepID=UPI00260E5696|nr:DUF6340 family protein [uncultured Eudoraea sp.]